MDGVPEAAGMGVATGAAMGIGATGLGRRRQAEQQNQPVFNSPEEEAAFFENMMRPRVRPDGTIYDPKVEIAKLKGEQVAPQKPVLLG